MIGTLFKVKVKPAKRRAFIKFIEWDVRVAKEQEDGTLQFDMYQDPKDENTFFVYEAYKDQNAFDVHTKNKPYQQFKSHVRPKWLTEFCTYFERIEAKCSLSF
jgi:quinol monooxygenase YgiN